MTRPRTAQEEADLSVLNGLTSAPPPKRASDTAKNNPDTPQKPTTRPKRTRNTPKTGENTPQTSSAKPKTSQNSGAKAPADPLSKPFTANITEYLVWLEAQTGDFKLFVRKNGPERLAGLAITMYGRWQTSPERRASRAEVRRV